MGKTEDIKIEPSLFEPPPPPYSATTADVDPTPQQNTSNLPSYSAQPQAPFSQRFNMQTISQNFQYDRNRGLIGNAFSFAGAIVNTATNQGYGASAAANTTSTTSGSQQNRSSLNQSAFNSFMQSRMEEKHMRMEEKHIRMEEKQMQKEAMREARQERREAKHERREMRRCNNRRGSPQHGVLDLAKSRGHLEINQSFTGDECYLNTRNGHIQIHGSLSASNSIALSTSNGNIVIDGQLSAGQDISLNSSNGAVVVNGSSIVSKQLFISTHDGPLDFKSFIEAGVVHLKNRNSPVMLSHVSIGSELSVKTSNAVVELRIEDIGAADAVIDIESSNAPVSVHLPRSFTGQFSIKTSTHNQANVVTNMAPDMLHYQTNQFNAKEGTFTNLGNKSNVQVHIKSSNAPVTLYI